MHWPNPGKSFFLNACEQPSRFILRFANERIEQTRYPQPLAEIWGLLILPTNARSPGLLVRGTAAVAESRAATALHILASSILPDNDEAAGASLTRLESPRSKSMVWLQLVLVSRRGLDGGTMGLLALEAEGRLQRAGRRIGHVCGWRRALRLKHCPQVLAVIGVSESHVPLDQGLAGRIVERGRLDKTL